MEIRSVAHKGLRRLIETGSPAGLPVVYAAKIEAMVSRTIIEDGDENGR
jgi:hypothetical protein